jgi:hypothetical protein
MSDKIDRKMVERLLENIKKWCERLAEFALKVVELVKKAFSKSAKGNKQSEVGKVIDSSREEFEAFCKDKNLGYIIGLRNYFTIMYDNLSGMRRDLVKKAEEGKEPTEMYNTIMGLYAEMFKVEEKVIMLNVMIENRKIKT